MKLNPMLLAFAVFSIVPFCIKAQTNKADIPVKKLGADNYFIDVHQLEPGKVKFEDVAKAHAKDLATEKKYGVNFIKYWVNEEKGLVYCLSTAADTGSIRKTHAEAHGLLPQHIYEVTDGDAAPLKGTNSFFLDVHYLGAGKVAAKDVEAVHQKDLVTEKKYGVNFINYWVDEKNGVVMCLSQAKDSGSIINTHREAHGLLPAYVVKVKQGE